MIKDDILKKIDEFRNRIQELPSIIDDETNNNCQLCLDNIEATLDTLLTNVDHCHLTALEEAKINDPENVQGIFQRIRERRRKRHQS